MKLHRDARSSWTAPSCISLLFLFLSRQRYHITCHSFLLNTLKRQPSIIAYPTSNILYAISASTYRAAILHHQVLLTTVQLFNEGAHTGLINLHLGRIRSDHSGTFQSKLVLNLLGTDPNRSDLRSLFIPVVLGWI